MAGIQTSTAPSATARAQARPLWQLLWRHRQEYLFISPFFIIFIFFHLYPLGWALFLSFNRWAGFGPMQFVGIDNYRAVLAEQQVRLALLNTVIFTAVLVPSGVLLSLVFANLLNIRDLKWRGAFRTIYFLPFITSTVIVAIVFQMMFDLSLIHI